eukprot:scaffold4232_cov107-Isochrysis_galbana.AAC.9
MRRFRLAFPPRRGRAQRGAAGSAHSKLLRRLHPPRATCAAARLAARTCRPRTPGQFFLRRAPLCPLAAGEQCGVARALM